MQIDRRQKWLDITLLVLGLFFLIMGGSDIGEDDLGVMLGFGMGLPMVGVYLWRAISRRKGKFAPAGWVCIMLMAAAMFFLMLLLGGINNGQLALSLFSLVFGGALAAAYVLRRREELRKAREEAETLARAEKQRVYVNQEQAGQRQAPKPTALTICPHCGAPAKEKICPYCGMEK